MKLKLAVLGAAAALAGCAGSRGAARPPDVEVRPTFDCRGYLALPGAPAGAMLSLATRRPLERADRSELLAILGPYEAVCAAEQPGGGPAEAYGWYLLASQVLRTREQREAALGRLRALPWVEEASLRGSPEAGPPRGSGDLRETVSALRGGPLDGPGLRALERLVEEAGGGAR